MEIKYKQYLLLMVAIIAVTLSACKKTDSTDVANEPVVIGYIMPGQPISVKVYQQKNIADTTTYGPLIGGLKLSVSDGTKNVALSETATGTYTYNDAAFLTAGKTYTLQFTYNGTTVSASTLMPAKPSNYTASRTYVNIAYTATTGDSTAVRFKWDNPDSLYHVLVFQNYNSTAFSIRARLTAPINFTLNPERADVYDAHNRIFNYTGVYDVILYSVNKEYIDQLTSNANTTSQQLANPPTNVTNGFGIFTAMQADTIRVSLVQL